MIMVDPQASKPKICVLGMGFVGLTLALTLSEIGHEVTGVDRRGNVIETLLSGKSHFFEHGIEDMLRHELANGLRLKTEIDPAATVYVVAVGTPIGDDRKPDTRDLRDVSVELGRILKRGDLVILRSTVPIGQTRESVLVELETASGLVGGRDFDLAFAPERTLEGKALAELRTLPQIVGGLTRSGAERAAVLFSAITPTTIIVDSLEAAEFVKVMNNAYRDVIFAFANEMALVCDRYNLDSHEIVHASNTGYDRSHVPLPSPGVGGYCLTKDPHIFAYAARRVGVEPTLVPAARNVNERMPSHVVGKVLDFLDTKSIARTGAKVLLLGIAFKGHPETSDIRFSPSLDVARELGGHGITVHGYDPRVHDRDMIDNRIVPVVDLARTMLEADAIVVMNNNPSFRSLPVVETLRSKVAPTLVFDAWKILSKEKLIGLAAVSYANLGFDNIHDDLRTYG